MQTRVDHEMRKRQITEDVGNDMRLAMLSRLLGALFFAGLLTPGGRSQPSGSRAPSLHSDVDVAVRSVCAPTIPGFRLSGGHLVAGHESADGGSVLCWYEDVTFTPPFPHDEPTITDAVATYVDGVPVRTSTADSVPLRPL